jgi:hypothetical protein
VKSFLIVGGLVCALALSASGVTWDVVDETYGSETGQVAFIYDPPWNPGGLYEFPWSDVPTESLSSGFVQLDTAAAGSGIDYAVRFDSDATFQMPGNGTWTLETKMQLHGAMGGTLYLADNAGPRWGSIITLNHLYNETVPHPNTIGDYNQRITNETDIALSGFDGSAVHTSRFERLNGSAVEMFVDDVSLGSISPGAGANGDAAQFEFGFGGGMTVGPGRADVYYVKVSSGAPLPMVEFTDVTLGDAMAMEFQSVQGTEYRLESTDQAVTNWQFAGMIRIGDGNVMHMYDPAGISTSKSYRIVLP